MNCTARSPLSNGNIINLACLVSDLHSRMPKREKWKMDWVMKIAKVMEKSGECTAKLFILFGTLATNNNVLYVLTSLFNFGRILGCIQL